MLENPDTTSPKQRRSEPKQIDPDSPSYDPRLGREKEANEEKKSSMVDTGVTRYLGFRFRKVRKILLIDGDGKVFSQLSY